MKLYKCLYTVLYGYKDSMKQTVEDWIDVECEKEPTEREIIDTLEGNNLLPKMFLEVTVHSIKEIERKQKVAGYFISCNTCKYSYLKKESMKEPCMYCTGHSHWESQR